MREELGINEKKHYKILTELGVETPELLEPNLQRNREQLFRIETYQNKLDLLLLELVESGISLQKALEIKSKQILAFKQEYQINPEEDAQILAKMFAQNSDLWRKSEALLTELQVLGHQQQNLKKSVPNPEANVFVLLRYLLGEKQQFVTVQLLSILEIVGEQPDALQLARRTGIMAKNVLFEILSNEQSLWEQRLSPKIMDVLTLSRNQVSKTNVQRLAEDETFVGTQTVCVEMAIEVLLELLKDLNPLTQATSLYGIYKLNAQKGIEQAKLILSQENLDELVRDTAENILQYGKVLGTLKQILRLFESGTFKSVNSDALIALARSGKLRTDDRQDI
jgi:hypothetical protein